MSQSTSLTATGGTTPDAGELLREGIAASQGNDSGDAIRLFTQACAAAPGEAVAHFLLGSEYAAAGMMSEAESGLATAVLLSPQLHIARYQLGLLQYSGGRPALGMLTWQPLAQLPETLPLPHFVRGFAALANDEIAEARVHFEAGLELNTGNPALGHDIRRVLESLNSLDPIPGATTDERPAAHVLVSNYGKFGSLH